MDDAIICNELHLTYAELMAEPKDHVYRRLRVRSAEKQHTPSLAGL
jgi:hypothetical protein